MWIVLRLLTLFVSFAIRLASRLSPWKPKNAWPDDTAYARIDRGKDGNVRSFRVGLDFEMPVIFSLHEEVGSDRFFKALGFAHEFQTGDAHFDRTIYIASDHPALHEYLVANDDLRSLVLDTLQRGYDSISADGKYLWLRHFGDVEPSEADVAQLDKLKAAFRQVGRHIKFRRDPYNLRVILVESVTYSLALYAIATIMEWGYSRGAVHLDVQRLITLGLMVAAGLFVFLLFVIKAFLGRSARGQRFVVESAVLLLLALPVTGISLVSEINRRYDRTEPQVISREIVKRYFTVRRSRRNRTLHYWVDFRHEAGIGATTLPRRLEVSRSLWERLPNKGSVKQVVRSGRFGLAWYAGFEGF